jgi:hypothetical protein
MSGDLITGRVTFRKFGVTKGGAPYLRVGITTDEGVTLYTSVWSNERYFELAPKMLRGTTVKVRGTVEGESLKVEAGSWKLS